MNFDPVPLLLSVKLAAASAVILLVLAMPLSFWLYFTRSPAGYLARVFVNLPLVLPPVVVGFYLLLLFNPSAPVGHFLQQVFHLRLVFTFEGLVVGSVLFNVPFMVNPVLSGLESLPRSLCEASFVLGKGRWTTFWRVLLPSIRPSLLTGLILTFAHTIGEFGMVLMIGGKIPGVTRVASIAVYDDVESLHFAAAHLYSAVLVIVSFAVLFLLILVNKRFARTW
ncbi:MAG TPA: molybdate ABC transporter permease subunit [Chitinivibrionales bacterium]|nr:molybdate ABC transporter permease subunit [Chitinivibrionales bacterium]